MVAPLEDSDLIVRIKEITAEEITLSGYINPTVTISFVSAHREGRATFETSQLQIVDLM